MMDGMTSQRSGEVATDVDRARDHLANERTYLAWVRTGATIMALGVGVASFAHRVRVSSAIAGALLVVVGAAGIVYGTMRFRHVTRDLAMDEFRVDLSGRPAIIASTSLILTVVVALVLLIIARH